MPYYVYILASARNGTLYVDVTNDLARRIQQHKSAKGSEFVRRFGVTRLVYAEPHADIRDAIAQEKRVKKWKRRWKLELIEGVNPDWRDLFDDLNS
jgi:putative endonuclease